MKQKTVRLILDCMMCDAMTPEPVQMSEHDRQFFS
jgi:hypothetical protein